MISAEQIGFQPKIPLWLGTNPPEMLHPNANAVYSQSPNAHELIH
ncbi:hypothetical protein HMPREF9699_01040 [Bergeyella zoohelcum ATCC 43767]|uniref:Uncharacterized protein n=1 Tax=Bergeyella zoohelcum ATCC 43767 TaxID=883096 RepID=K1MN27_9FLAO|nr:hypothetical protein HMPREF9699_01040 [Bergeyella zoohelcum ATCC 43767]SUV48776.1 Uncharacterised protein [Bergeyella zoohelcum]